MRIIVLDGYTLNPGDLSWEALESLGGLTVYDRTPPELIAKRICNAEVLFTNKCVISKAVIDGAPKLKYIGVLATGYNVVDTEYAKEKGITVTNIPDYCTQSVVQLTLGLIINIVMRLPAHIAEVKEGKWVSSQDFSFFSKDITELSGKTIGVVGFGNIGKRVAELAKILGMRVIIYNKGKTYDYDYEFAETLDALLTASDIVTLHCPLNAANAKMINAETLKKMKRGAYLINTARGGLIDEEALAAALNSEYLSGVALDVLSEEPPKESNPLLFAKNIIITPHIAWASKEAREELMRIAAENLKSYLNGKTVNVV